MLLDDSRWKGQIFVGGAWVPGAGGVADVVEPATGATLAQSGLAGPADVETAAVNASEAQRDWAALPHPARAAVLRKAGRALDRACGGDQLVEHPRSRRYRRHGGLRRTRR